VGRFPTSLLDTCQHLSTGHMSTPPIGTATKRVYPG
jgi:hypothetical protein